MCTFLLSSILIPSSEFLGHRVCIYSALVNNARQVSRVVRKFSPLPAYIFVCFCLFGHPFLGSACSSLLVFFFFFKSDQACQSRVLMGNLDAPLSAGGTARKPTKKGRKGLFLIILPHPHPLCSTTTQASRSFTLARVPVNNRIWHLRVS